MGDAVRNLDERIRGVEGEILGVEQKIGGVEGEIRAVEQKIQRVEEQIETCLNLQERARLDGKEERLRAEETQLRAEKALLRDEEGQLRAKEERFWAEKAQLREQQIQHGRGLSTACESAVMQVYKGSADDLGLLGYYATRGMHSDASDSDPRFLGTRTNDNALSIRKYIVEQRVRLCDVDALQGLLKTELEAGLRFPVFLNMWDSLPTDRDKLFKLAGPDEECYEIVPLVNAIVDPPMPAPTADTKESFHHFWDTVTEEPLKFFSDGPWLSERNKSGEGSNSGTRPHKVVRFGFQFYALWRGEEKGPSSAGDPRKELISKLEWTYKHLPFLMAYHARATRVTFCALHVVVDSFGESKKMCKDLIGFNTSQAEDRLELVLACITLAKSLKTMQYVCESEGEVSDMPLIRRGSGKIIRPCGRKVEKLYPSDAWYRKVTAIYEATSSCPNVERLMHRRDSDQTIVVQRAVVAKPNNNDKLITCIRCLCEALQWLHGKGLMHRDIRWENVLRDWDNAGKWVLVDLDEVIKRDECFELHPLDAISHAPEMIVGPHDTMVDIWGIGHLLFTSNILLDSKLSGLMERCLHQVPDQRPTAAECLKVLDM